MLKPEAVPKAATEDVIACPVNPITSVGDIDPTEAVKETPVNPITSAGDKDPTAEVETKTPADHTHGRADLQQEKMFIEMIIEGVSAIDETILE